VREMSAHNDSSEAVGSLYSFVSASSSTQGNSENAYRQYPRNDVLQGEFRACSANRRRRTAGCFERLYAKVRTEATLQGIRQSVPERAHQAGLSKKGEGTGPV